MLAAIALEQDLAPTPKIIHNHDIMHCTADGVVGNHLYSGRALGITQPWDKIQLHSDLKPLWNDITEHYDRIGLKHTRDVLWFLNSKQLGSHIGYKPSVFFFGPNEYENWGDFRWYNAVSFINSKNNFMQLATALGVDTPKTLCFDSISEVTSSKLEKVSYPCYLKAAISVAGVGIYRCLDEKELLVNLKKFSPQTPIQIQEEIQSNIFLNLQYRIINKTVYRLAASEQILNGYTHQGNRMPSSFEPWDQVDPMALWLKNNGMKGIFAFDLAVVKTDKGYRFPAIECNPRYNGASYPTLIAQKLGISEWSALTFDTEARDLSELDLSGIEYDRETGEGAILVNWGTILEGKLAILLAGPRPYQEALEQELYARL